MARLLTTSQLVALLTSPITLPYVPGPTSHPWARPKAVPGTVLQSHGINQGEDQQDVVLLLEELHVTFPQFDYSIFIFHSSSP